VKGFGTRSDLVVLLFLLITMMGCGALDASQPSAQSAQTNAGSSQVTLTPKTVAFGNVQVGKTQTLSATLSNTGRGVVIITHAAISGPGFALATLKLPLTLNPGQKILIGVRFAPTAGGMNQGTISLLGNTLVRSGRRGNRGRRGAITGVSVTTLPMTINLPISGLGAAAGQLAVSPAALSLGKVKLGSTQTQAALLTNSGGSAVTISHATVSGRGFKMSGLTFPLTLAPGQKKNFSVTFTPQSAGTSTGSVAVTSDAPNSVVSVPLSGVAVTSGALTSNPSSLSFRGVQAGQTRTLPITLTNLGSTSVTVSQASVTGAGFKVTGALPATLDAGQSTSLSVTYTAQAATSSSGSLAVISNASNPMLAVPLSASASGATAGVLSTSDSSLTFASVPVGGSSTQSETLTNTGNASVTITQAKVSSASFTVTGLSLPLTLTAGQSFTFGAAFSPKIGGSNTGTISVISNASNPTLTISLAGTASVSGQLAASPATLNFGSVTVGQSKSLSGLLTASGSSITISNASMSTSEFKASGLTLPFTLAAGKSVSFTITFAPQASGTAVASASFISNASNASAQQSLTGSGAAAPQHSVALNWNPSTSSVVGYNVYRGTTTGGPYSRITSMNADTSFTDSAVQAGQTYFYVTTAVDGSGKESAHSNQTQAAIPTP
jgi:hypothetical protein